MRYFEYNSQKHHLCQIREWKTSCLIVRNIIYALYWHCEKKLHNILHNKLKRREIIVGENNWDYKLMLALKSGH